MDKINIQGIDLMMSTACNLHCPGCYGHMSHNSGANMSLETAVDATRFAMANRPPEKMDHPFSIVFFGGEPLLNWEVITRYLEWLRKNIPPGDSSYLLYLFTNGLLLDKEKLELLMANNVQVFLSLDGLYEQHCQRRPMPESDYENILSMVRLMVDRNQGENLTVYCVVEPEKFHTLKTYFRFLSNLGVQNVELSRDGDVYFDSKDRAELLELVKQSKREYPEMKFSFNPESAMDCVSCEPRFVLVYPNGDVFDLCYLCAWVLYRRGKVRKKALDCMYLGKINEMDEIRLDLNEKRRLVRDQMFCPTIQRKYSKELEALKK